MVTRGFTERRALGAMDGTPCTVLVCGSNRFIEAVTGHLVAMGAICAERFGGA